MCLILDDLGYVRKDQAETAVLFELIAERYERKSLIITCNQPFSEWNQVFPDPAVTVAVIDRLVHHSTILEINTESYRRLTAAESNATANKARAKLSATTASGACGRSRRGLALADVVLWQQSRLKEPVIGVDVGQDGLGR